MQIVWRVVIVGLVLIAGMRGAEAARGIAIVNTGEDVMEVGQVKPELKAEVEAKTSPGVSIGVMYNRFGLFWLDIVRWNKRYVLFQGNTVYEIPEEVAKEIAAGSLDKPFTLTIPPGMIVLIALGLGFVAILVIGGKNKAPDSPDIEGTPGAPEGPGMSGPGGHAG
jgi:hypothetical protein